MVESKSVLQTAIIKKGGKIMTELKKNKTKKTVLVENTFKNRWVRVVITERAWTNNNEMNNLCES